MKKHPKVTKLPPIYHFPVMQRPRCSMDVRTAETIRYRELPQVAEEMARKGLTPYACANMATYRIGEEWYCGKHAGLVALSLLAIDVPQGEQP